MEAVSVWEELGVGSAEREKSEGGPNGIPEPVKLKDILSIFGKNARRQTALGVFLMGMQQLSGIDGVLYVSAPLVLLAPTTNDSCSTHHYFSNPQD